MRIGWVLPWIHGIGGNKTVFSVAEAAARLGWEGELIAHTVLQPLIPEIRSSLGRVGLHHVRTTSRAYRPHLDPIAWQLAPFRDRKLGDLVAKVHLEHPLDFVILVSNEGHSLASELRRRALHPRPLVGCSVMELIDHSFLLRRERDLRWLRSLFMAVYPALHWSWGRALREFDFLLANSNWTSETLGYLYGLATEQALISIPESAFGSSSSAAAATGQPYIAVPTVSVGPEERALLASLRDDGLRLVAFGPRALPFGENRGYLTEDGVRAILAGAAATLFVFDYEGLGLVPFESLAQGTPVVTLPKHAVHRQWAGSPFVSFGTNPGELAAACRRWVAAPPAPDLRSAIRAAVEPYRADHAAAELVRTLERVRDRYAGSTVPSSAY